MYPAKEEIPQHDVERRNKLDDKGNRKFSTTFKKSFIEIPKVEKPLPRIDIIVNSSFSRFVDARTQMIYASMSAISLAEKLSQSGIDYRIIASYPLETYSGGYEVYSFVNIKKEGQTFDRNNTAVLLSDARNFRYNQFRGFLATQYDAGYDDYIEPYGIGSPLNDAGKIKRAYMDYLASSDNPEDVKASLNPQSKFVISGALSESQAVAQYDNIIKELKELKDLAP
jgi:hypothetical protein